ncbi:hypothetical protein FHS29_005596 [Saccharothrix tamanrassetensis]|uniref:Uncharacterized protein n=1 Tax=Saccharothrix tamanrassetensis TaxID=1051531 RepID=A0A841CSH0_9PSEU|nr:hypothetical protein [Saccharothrix tamanrassetensis]MBB5958987.1 hypothetical protein [Saccharothrix tamanrassetensis]
MSNQLNLALECVDKAMAQLRVALRDVPYRREGFRSDHTAFVKSMAQLRVALSYSRSQLESPSARRRRRGSPRT